MKLRLLYERKTRFPWRLCDEEEVSYSIAQEENLS